MKKIRSIVLILFVIIVILWFVFGIIPFLEPNISVKIVNLLSVSFSAATALFTGIAFVVAFGTLIKQHESIANQQRNLEVQQESLVQQTNLTVFSVFIDSMKIVTNSKSFKQCQDYILSDNFLNDKEFIIEKLKKPKDYEISLEEYSIVLDAPNNDDKRIEDLRESRDKIKTFCMRMEFMGIMVSRLNEKTAENLMIDLYGHTIKKTYKRLGPIITKNDDNKSSKNMYPNYTHLFNLAKDRG